MRQLGPVSLATILFLSFGLAVIEISALPAAAQTAQPTLLRTSRPATPLVPKAPDPSLVTVAPPGSALYVAKRGDSIPLVAHKYLSQTSYLTSSELTEAIHKANGDFHSTFLKAGQPVIIPGLLPAPIVEKSVPVERDFEVRAIYLTGLMAASDHGIRIIKPLARSGRKRRRVRHQGQRWQRDHSLRSSLARSAPQLFPRSAQVHPFRAFAEHARHRPRRHFPRPAPGGDSSRAGSEVAKNGAAVARERQTGLDRFFPAQGAGV